MNKKLLEKDLEYIDIFVNQSLEIFNDVISEQEKQELIELIKQTFISSGQNEDLYNDLCPCKDFEPGVRKDMSYSSGILKQKKIYTTKFADYLKRLITKIEKFSTEYQSIIKSFDKKYFYEHKRPVIHNKELTIPIGFPLWETKLYENLTLGDHASIVYHAMDNNANESCRFVVLKQLNFEKKIAPHGTLVQVLKKRYGHYPYYPTEFFIYDIISSCINFECKEDARTLTQEQLQKQISLMKEERAKLTELYDAVLTFSKTFNWKNTSEFQAFLDRDRQYLEKTSCRNFSLKLKHLGNKILPLIYSLIAEVNNINNNFWCNNTNDFSSQDLTELNRRILSINKYVDYLELIKENKIEKPTFNQKTSTLKRVKFLKKAKISDYPSVPADYYERNTERHFYDFNTDTVPYDSDLEKFIQKANLNDKTFLWMMNNEERQSHQERVDEIIQAYSSITEQEKYLSIMFGLVTPKTNSPVNSCTEKLDTEKEI